MILRHRPRTFTDLRALRRSCEVREREKENGRARVRTFGMSAADASPSASLAQLADAYLTALFEAHPTMAAGLGLHEYDGRMPDLGEAARARRTAGLRDLRARLGAIPYGALDLEDAHDHTLLAHAIDEELFELEQLREFERNPLAFSGPLD